MSRLSTALAAASLLLPALAGAQTPPPASPAKPPSAAPANTAPAKPAAPSPSLGATPPAATPPGAELDPATRDLVRREVERAKEDMRDEIRAEIQGAQSAREFMETTAAGDRPKLEFLQLNGYLRTRGDLLDNLDLRRDADRSGYFLFPRPLLDPAHRGTVTSANMRFRLEPTLNVSEQVRVMAQLDLLDDLVLGQTPQGLLAKSDAIVRPFDARTQVPPENGVNSDRSSVVVKRAWAEVQTPVGLLSFGR
ncbi:MAG: TIGR04551 family protein, partial [Anaeromyxobacteraceae bacterium]